MLNEQSWPAYDEAKCKDDTVEIVVQVNGKIKARVMIAANADKDAALAAANGQSAVSEALSGKTVVKEIYVPGKLLNLVVR